MARKAGSAYVEIEPKASPNFGARLKESIKPALSDVGKTAAGVLGGLGGAAVARGAFDFVHDSIAEFQDAEVAQTKFQQAFAKSPELARANRAEFEKLNSTLATKTRFDDDATASAEAVLANFHLTAEQMKTLIPLVQDYAARTGKDLPTAAQNVGRTFLGNTRAMKELGVNFKATGDRGKDFAAVTDLLRDKVGGFAEKEGKTTSGRLEIMQNQFGELKETVGSAVVPMLLRFVTVLTGLVTWVSNLSPAAKTLLTVLGGLGVVVFGIVKAVQAWTAVQGALNVVLDANPIGLVVLGIAALVAGIVLAYQHSETFRNIVQAAFAIVSGAVRDTIGFFEALGSGVARIVGGAVSFLRNNWQNIIVGLLTGGVGLAVLFIAKHFDDIVGFVTGMPGRIARGAKGMWNGILEALRGVLRTVQNWWNDLHFTIGGGQLPFPPHTKFPSFTLNTPDIHLPGLALGGTAIAPGLAVVGEKGAEIVELPRGATVRPLSKEARPLIGQLVWQGSGDRREVDDFAGQLRDNAWAAGW
jgi:hypothetical protein